MAYEGGFQQGMASRVEIPSMKDQLMYYDKRMTVEREAEKTRAEAAAKARQTAKEQLIKETKAEFKSAADPTFKATGIFDVDSLGREVSAIAQDQITLNQYAFDQGKIDGVQYRNFNQNLNTDVKKLEDGIEKASGFVAEKEKLEESGKGSFINDLKQEIAVNVMKNVKYEAKPDGHLSLVTLQQDSREVAFLPEQMENMFNAEAGVGDLSGEVDDIVKNAGSYEYILKDKSGKLIKYTEGPGKSMERLKGFWETRVNQMSDYDIIDGLHRVGMVVEDEMIAGEDQIVINANNLLEIASDPKKIEEYKDILKEKLALETNNKLAFMQGTRKAMPSDPGGDSGIGKDALVSTARVLAKDAKDGYGDRIQIVPRDLRGLQATGLTFDDAFIRTALGDIQNPTIQQTGMGPLISGPEAIKNAKVVGANQFLDSGAMQVEFQYEFDMLDPNDPEGKMITKTNVVKLDYKDLEDINKFRGGFNLPLIESKDFDSARQGRAQQSSGSVNRMAKYNQ